jgi:phage baseplate assembly protein W
MRGMDAATGRAIDGLAHLSQSIEKCLTTPMFSRVFRRPFGSELLDLVDAPTNPATCVKLYAAVATVLMKYEPRLRLARVSLVMDPDAPGTVVIDVQGTTTISPDAVSVRVNLS